MRLTDKVGIDYIYSNFVSLNEPHKSVANKLGKLEDIEDELGIDLILFLKVMMNRIIYVKGKEPEWAGTGTKKDIETYYVEGFTKEELSVRYSNSCAYDLHFILNPIKNYGKTWALTKEELENEE